jgi:hypothetical protein
VQVRRNPLQDAWEKGGPPVVDRLAPLLEHRAFVAVSLDAFRYVAGRSL